MTQNNFGIGIVGCGAVADIHLQAIQSISEGNLVAVQSRSEGSAREAGEEYDVPYYTDMDEFLSRDDIDLISICTPNSTHRDLGVQGAEAGKHVTVEKPIDITVERGQELIDVCEEQGVTLSVIYQSRFIPGIRELKDQLDNNVLGDGIHLADAYVKWFRAQEYYEEDWKGTLEYDGGGALINQSIHTIDLLQWLAGDVESIYGQTGTFTHPGVEAEDTAVAVLRFRTGAIGVIEGATSVTPAMDRRIEIHGPDGTAILEGTDVSIQKGDKQEEDKPEEETEKEGAESPFSGFSIEPHANQYRQIITAIQQGEQPGVSGEEALKSLKIVRGIYESSETGQPVEL